MHDSDGISLGDRSGWKYTVQYYCAAEIVLCNPQRVAAFPQVAMRSSSRTLLFGLISVSIFSLWTAITVCTPGADPRTGSDPHVITAHSNWAEPSPCPQSQTLRHNNPIVSPVPGSSETPLCSDFLVQEVIAQRDALVQSGESVKYTECLLFNVWEAVFSCHAGEQRVGVLGDGGKWMCDPTAVTRSPCVIYSFGSNGDTSFEASLVQNHGGGNCDIHIFDPTLSGACCACESFVRAVFIGSYVVRMCLNYDSF